MYNAAILSRKLGIELVNCVNSLIAQSLKPEKILILTIRDHLSGEGTNATFKDNLIPNKIDIIIDYNSPSEDGYILGVSSGFKSASSMARLRNNCIRFFNEGYNSQSNLLFLDSDIRILSKSSCMQMDELCKIYKVVCAPVRSSGQEYEPLQICKGSLLTHTDPIAGLKMFQKYERGLTEEQVRSNETIEFEGCSGSCTMLSKDVVNDMEVRFSPHPQGEWIGLWDSNKDKLGKSVILPSVQTIHRSYWSH